jgi:DNA-binding SARP family transcriptional activator
MWIGLLGPLQVTGELVSAEELADALWDGMPPDRAADTIRNYMKRLRFRLGPGGKRVVT